MKNLLTLLFALASVLFASCRGNTESARVRDEFNAEAMISQKNSLQKILTKEIVAAVTNVPVDKIGEHIENNINQQGQYTLLYSWPTGNTKKIAGGQYEIAAYHSISIGFVKKITAEAFEQYYGTNDGVQEQVNQMAQQENFNKEVGTAEAKYLAGYAEERKIKKLENVATKAFWETPMNALHVLANDAAFTITANMGDDETLARETSVEVVNAILNP